ncbi:hypothetical protein Ciccas_007042 [Cichlidogyrus casuarinus]|uniref:Uncharacterized protein n=1 Tax=Cichlidogyrus casuarinus TaxID=1844966 RepID=A0ABD2Q403_9PLAT
MHRINSVWGDGPIRKISAPAESSPSKSVKPQFSNGYEFTPDTVANLCCFLGQVCLSRHQTPPHPRDRDLR